ncbi:universal stress protein [Marinobacter panjinensis]|uniref:Universal stress protein n=1 Tax=Marinobacter panjinensis TaxID=2576384 RepID=A0A4U6R376_9GAMM|nr:universal stress protein [Marinobacter panjinensis]MCR8913124.1 universal stress protein [Marinobacter panjinensis]TKV68184.1 universal stress protein [Marinobacter panjinensis]
MYRKLLIAIDPDDDGEGKRALAAAMDLLDEDGELHLASVYSPGGGGFFPHVTEEAPEKKEAEVREVLDLLVRKYLPLNRSASLHVVAGNAGQKLVGLAGQLCADLLMLVSRGSSGHWPMRRATVEYVSVNAPCPVLVLPSLEKSGPEAGEKQAID